MSLRLSELFLRSQSDEQLVSLAQAGNERAFAAIVERYGQELHARACRMRMNGRAEDVVQQTFMSAFAALRSGTEVKHLRGWLYRILRNEAIRASDRRVVEVQLDPAAVVSEPLEEGAQRRMLAFDTLSSIAALPARQRDALVATALGGESRAAVAASMGVSEGAVRQLMHRARASLRTAATAILPGPLVRWLQAIRNGVRTDQAEIALGAGAGTASAGGVAVKVGALLASGVVATGIVGSQLSHRRVVHHSRVAPAHAAVAPTTRGALNAVTARLRLSGSPGARGGGETSARASNGVLPGRPTTRAGAGGEREHVVSAAGARHGGAGAGSRGGPGSGTEGARGPATEGASGGPKGDGSSGGASGAIGGSGRDGGSTGDGGASSVQRGSTGSDGGSTTGGDGSSSGGAVSSRDGDSGGSTPTSTLGISDGGSTSGSSDGGSSNTSGSSDGGSSSSDGSGDGGSGSTGSSDSGSSSGG